MNDGEEIVLRDIQVLLESLRRAPRVDLWAVVSALSLVKQLEGSARLWGMRLVANALIRGRAFPDVAATLCAELLELRADATAIDLAAELAELGGDYEKARAYRRLKSEVPSFDDEPDAFTNVFSTVTSQWVRQRKPPMSGRERLEWHFALVERLEKAARGPKRRQSAKRTPPSRKRRTAR
ncbi:MAG: hypothetical protein GQE15_13765 [Archangiaceae bacterium]|nr:hypothetical protein [Archangiaceae bacterium]